MQHLTQGASILHIYSWDGTQFRNLLACDKPECPEYGDIWLEPHGNIWFRDLDGDGIAEVVAFSGMPIAADAAQFSLPWRYEWQYYRWDGTYYVLYDRDFSAPTYRFQAVRDGDRLTLSGRYDEALSSYQEAIFSDKLEWWSAERRKYEQDAYVFEHWGGPAPAATPQPDPDEHPNLAAYSRYRIMLLHVLRGWNTEAKAVYDTLQAKYPDGAAGHAYAKMADAFWTEYQASKSLEDACGTAVQYATQHREEILHYIGGDFFGWQNPSYEPADICPFR